MTKRGWIIALGLIAMIGLTGQAEAHGKLKQASPAADSTVKAAPGEVIITFTEALEPKFSRIEVQDPKGSGSIRGPRKRCRANPPGSPSPSSRCPPEHIGSHGGSFRSIPTEAKARTSSSSPLERSGMSLETADWVRAIERGLHLAASFSVFGAILFRTVLARPVVKHLSDGAAERFDRACTGLVWFSAEVALFAAAAWLLMQGAYMSLSETVGGTFEAIPAVLFGTAFGQLLLFRLLLLGAAVALFKLYRHGGRIWSLLLAGASVALHAGIGARSGDGRRVRHAA